MSSKEPIEKLKEPSTYKIVALYVAMPILLHIFTSLPGINKLTPIIALLAIAALFILRFVPSKKANVVPILWVLLVLSLVGSTGWFYSPFFFALYLTAIGLGFIYTPSVAVGFTVALIAIFSYSIGEVDALSDFFILVSLLSVIPITIVLRKSFLLVQQQQKGILILETEQKSGITSLDAVLENKINFIGVTLRQPITYLKQGLAMLDDNSLTDDEFADTLARMRKASEELSTFVKEFERGTTNNAFFKSDTKKK
jgi:signal transduction histidine kinase